MAGSNQIDQKAIVQELINRRSSLAPDKQDIVDELATRFGIVSPSTPPTPVEAEPKGFMDVMGDAITNGPSRMMDFITGHPVHEMAAHGRELGKQAVEEYKGGEPIRALGTGLASFLPGVGDEAMAAGNDIGEGNYGGGLAHSILALAPSMAPVASRMELPSMPEINPASVYKAAKFVRHPIKGTINLGLDMLMKRLNPEAEATAQPWKPINVSMPPPSRFSPTATETGPAAPIPPVQYRTPPAQSALPSIPPVQWHQPAPEAPLPAIPPVKYNIQPSASLPTIPPVKYNTPTAAAPLPEIPPVRYNQAPPAPQTAPIPPVTYSNRFSQPVEAKPVTAPTPVKAPESVMITPEGANPLESLRKAGMAKDDTIANYLKGKGITPEQWNNMSIDEKNVHVKSAVPKARALGKSGPLGRDADTASKDIFTALSNLWKP